MAVYESTQLTLVVGLRVENAKNGQEQVDNIEIQADGSRNLFFNVVLAHNHLRIDENIGAENQCCETAVYELAGGAVGEKHGHEAKEDETPQGAEEIWHP